jgi:hypothetical protein
LRRGHREGARDAEQGHHCEHRTGRVHAQNRERQQGEGARHVEEVAARQDLAPVVVIGGVACGQDQQDERQELRQSDQAEIQRVRSRRVDLPADGDGLHLHGERAERTRHQVADERVLVREIRWGRRGTGGHSLLF